MALAEYLHPQAVLLNPSVVDKWVLIREMAAAAAAAGRLAPERVEEAQAALEARERSVSTGMENGVAVPHAALPDLETVIAGLAVLPQGLDFQSLDGKPAQIVVMLLVPKEEKVLHVRTLTEVARRLGDAEFRRQVLAAQDSARVLGLWSSTAV